MAQLLKIFLLNNPGHEKNITPEFINFNSFFLQKR